MIDPVRQEIIANAATMVVKIGTGVLTRADASLDGDRIASLVDEVHEILKTGRQVVIVSSGAIGAGIGQLGLTRRPKDLPRLQAAASVGQSYLMQAYDAALRRFGYHAAQILLTAADFEDRARYLNVRNTILTLFAYKAVPIINENDTVSVDEIRFGDNDRLAAMVTNLLRAPLLVILSVVDGLYTSDPGAKQHKGGDSPSIIRTVSHLDDVSALAGNSRSSLGTGGMTTKLEAARMCTAAGEAVLVVGGKRRGVLTDVLAGRLVGTLFLPQSSGLQSRKRWIGFTVRPRGRYIVDAGARRAVERDGKSLLAIGIVDVAGQFDHGDVTTICDSNGVEFARGLSNYSADDARKIRGLRTSQIAAALGSLPYDEVIHRDNLVVTGVEKA
jgi:glutamate 5-kinase